MKAAGRRKNQGSGNHTVRERFQYWFDNRMSHSSLGLIRALIVASVLLALILAGLIILFRFHGEEGADPVFWNSIATVVNAEFPYFEDGSVGYIILMAIIAIAGVLFTSTLIGIITSAIEEKIIDLKKGNSMVLEEGHFVILGFVPGEFTLLNQLILASEGAAQCIVLASGQERDTMEQSINEGLDVPDNIRIICRTADITDPNSLVKLSIGTCRSVIINPTDDLTTIKTILAVSTLSRNSRFRDVRVNAIISSDEYQFPPSIADANNITALQTNDTMARIIAHSCTQTGISELFTEMFNYEGSELYLICRPEAEGKSFYELSFLTDNGVPVGLTRGKEIVLNPMPGEIVGKGEKILVFAENQYSASISAESLKLAPPSVCIPDSPDEESQANTVIFGSNESLHILIQELPENISQLTLVNVTEKSRGRRRAEKAAAKRGLVLKYYEENPDDDDLLLEIARTADHIILLNDHTKSVDEADMDIIFLLLNFRDLRNRYHFNYNITAEMRSERNQNLVSGDDKTDFIVASSLSSLFLAQLAESPELIDVFRELLSNEGNELYMKSPQKLGISGTLSVRELRMELLKRGSVFLGYYRCGESHINPSLNKEVEITDDTRLLVISRQ